MTADGKKLQAAPFTNSVANYTKDLKNSLLLKDDMPNMLASAPMALALLGRCKLLSLSDAAAQVTMRGPNNRPFQHLKYVISTNPQNCGPDGFQGGTALLVISSRS